MEENRNLERTKNSSLENKSIARKFVYKVEDTGVLSGLLLGILFGLSFALTAYHYISMERLENELDWAAFLLGALLILFLVGSFFFLFERTLFRYFLGKPNVSIQSLGQDLYNWFFDLFAGHYQEAREKSESLISDALAMYASFKVRRWFFSTALTIIVAFTATLGTILLFNQNELLKRQNELLKNQNTNFLTQNRLIEAQRRSSLLIEMTSLFEEIQKFEKYHQSNESNELNEFLVGRVISLSQSLHPYKFMDYGYSDSLKKRSETQFKIDIGSKAPIDLEDSELFLSPERGHLFKALASSKIDFGSLIIGGAKFDYADLRGSVLRGNFPGVSLTNSDLTETSIIKGNLSMVDFTGAVMKSAKFHYTNLSGAFLEGTSLVGAQFKNTSLIDTNFESADLSKADFDGAIIGKAISDNSYNEWLLNISNIVSRGFEPDKWIVVKEIFNCNFSIEKDQAYGVEPNYFRGEVWVVRKKASLSNVKHTPRKLCAELTLLKN